MTVCARCMGGFTADASRVTREAPFLQAGSKAAIARAYPVQVAPSSSGQVGSNGEINNWRLNKVLALEAGIFHMCRHLSIRLLLSSVALCRL